MICRDPYDIVGKPKKEACSSPQRSWPCRVRFMPRYWRRDAKREVRNGVQHRAVEGREFHHIAHSFRSWLSFFARELYERVNLFHSLRFDSLRLPAGKELYRYLSAVSAV